VNPIPRLVPDRALPAYSFVPGRFPHPESDPRGHSFAASPTPPPPLDPDRWCNSPTYLYGIDLFNAGYFWEAHVEWESLWLAAGRTGAVADFLKGLIKLAAAGVKGREGRSDGVRGHARRAAELFQQVAAAHGECLMGLRFEDLLSLSQAAEECAAAGSEVVYPPIFPR
jgi:hypothetical protein